MGEQVKRYMVRDPGPSFGQPRMKVAVVRAADYDTLQAECERVSSDLDKAWRRAETAEQNARIAAQELAALKEQFGELHKARNLLSKLSSAGFDVGGDAAESILAMCSEPAALKAQQSAEAATLAEQMKAAGMLTVDEMIAGAPLDAFIAHSGVKDLATYGQWLEMKCREFLAMQAKRDLNKQEGDDLYEWVIAHAAVFQEARINFNAAIKAHPVGYFVHNGNHWDEVHEEFKDDADVHAFYALPVVNPQLTTAEADA